MTNIFVYFAGCGRLELDYESQFSTDFTLHINRKFKLQYLDGFGDGDVHRRETGLFQPSFCFNGEKVPSELR